MLYYYYGHFCALSSSNSTGARPRCRGAGAAVPQGGAVSPGSPGAVPGAARAGQGAVPAVISVLPERRLQAVPAARAGPPRG